MNSDEVTIQVGDRVIISRPRSTSRFAGNIERLSTVTAVRPKSFDAGGLCFRNDGREWGGHNRLRLIPPDGEQDPVEARTRADEASRLERSGRAREDSVLAFLLTSRPEKEWLKLGIDELRRIAALHGIMPTRAQSLAALNIHVND
jgi:hypothetical protein